MLFSRFSAYFLPTLSWRNASLLSYCANNHTDKTTRPKSTPMLCISWITPTWRIEKWNILCLVLLLLDGCQVKNKIMVATVGQPNHIRHLQLIKKHTTVIYCSSSLGWRFFEAQPYLFPCLARSPQNCQVSSHTFERACRNVGSVVWYVVSKVAAFACCGPQRVEYALRLVLTCALSIRCHAAFLPCTKLYLYMNI